MDNTEISVEGIVESVTYHNEKNGYAIFRVDSDDSERPVVVVGNTPYIGVGESVVVHGSWVKHPVYGEQLKADLVERRMPAGAVAILQYLSSGNVKGIGPVTAKRIVERFGDNTFDVLEKEPDKLAQIPGINRKKADEIAEGFKRQQGIRRLMDFLLRYRIRSSVAMTMYKWYGDMADEFIRDNPYILADERVGVPFDVVDSMALDMGFDTDSSERIEAGLMDELSHNQLNGHVFIPAAKLVDATAQMLTVETDDCADCLNDLIDRGALVKDEIAGLDAVYLSRVFEMESESAERLCLMADNPPPVPENLDKLIDNIAAGQRVEYTELQREAIRLAALNRVFLLTGGPGTGKSTSVRGMLSVFDELGYETVLCSPTGRAAKRLSELSGRPATTIHRLLEVDFDSPSAGFSFVHNSEEPLKADVVILDETSMVDLELFSALLDALSPEARLILVGDPDQLPSVGAGNVLKDLILSGRIATVELNEIFRQSQSSNIILAAHAVNSGELPKLDHKSGDFFFSRKNNPQSVAETIVDMCVRRIPKGMGYEPSQIQVLSPTRKGAAGTSALNIMLQAALNPPEPGKAERRSGEFVFRVGDRVMHIRNNYDLVWESVDHSENGMGVFNGDVGVVQSIDNRSETLTVKYDDRLVDYSFEQLNELEPAYAMTVHKSQGSEYPCVILSAADAPSKLLLRPVLYTAITRASGLLVIVGSEGVLTQMIGNNRRAKRYSGLKFRMKR